MNAALSLPFASVPSTAPSTEVDDDTMLGQFIPLHYHYQMLDQQERIGAFERAIDAVVEPGMKVLELGGGTGVLSFFAARAGADRVYCVERTPHVAAAARQLLATNGVASKVQVIMANAFDYLPPERVDVVVCELLHTAMLREKQMEVIAAFKERYLAHFGGPLPRFVPEAVVLAAQPCYTDYDFHGYRAAVPMFVDGSGNGERVTDLAAPQLYASFLYESPFATNLACECVITAERSGVLNSIRFRHANLVAITGSTSIDWQMHDLVIPLDQPIEVLEGQEMRISFAYESGASFLALSRSLRAELVGVSSPSAPPISTAPASAVRMRK